MFTQLGIYADIFEAVVYGILYLLFTTFTFVFQQSYGFSESTGYANVPFQFDGRRCL